MKANPLYKVAFDDLNALIAKHADKLTSLQLLAIAANMVGKLAALQDQRHVSPERAMAVIVENIKLGNAEIVADLANKPMAGNA